MGRSGSFGQISVSYELPFFSLYFSLMKDAFTRRDGRAKWCVWQKDVWGGIWSMWVVLLLGQHLLDDCIDSIKYVCLERTSRSNKDWPQIPSDLGTVIYHGPHSFTHRKRKGKKIRYVLGFPGSSDGKASACNAGDPGLIPGSRRDPEEGNDNPLQYSCLENRLQSMRSQKVRHN